MMDHVTSYINLHTISKPNHMQPDLAQTTLRQLGEAHGHQLQQLALQDPQALARYVRHR